MKFRIYSRDLAKVLAAVNHGKKPKELRDKKSGKAIGYEDTVRSRVFLRAQSGRLFVTTCDKNTDGNVYTAESTADILEEGTGDADFRKLQALAKSRKDDLVYETRPTSKNSHVDCGETTVFMNRDPDTYAIFNRYTAEDDVDFCEFCREEFERIFAAGKALPPSVTTPEASESLIVTAVMGKKPKAVFTNAGAALVLESAIPSTVTTSALVPRAVCTQLLESDWDFVAVSPECAKTDSGLFFRWGKLGQDDLNRWSRFAGTVDGFFSIESEVFCASCESLHAAVKSLKAFCKKGYEAKIFPDERGLRILRHDGFPGKDTPAAETIAPGNCKPFKPYSLDLRLLMAGIPKTGTLRIFLDRENTALIRIDGDPLSSIVLPCRCNFENRDSIFY